MSDAGSTRPLAWSRGAVTATAGPTVASLIGDFFAARDRSRMYGYILAGELVGTGFGFLISGELAAWFGWHYAFLWLHRRS